MNNKELSEKLRQNIIGDYASIGIKRVENNILIDYDDKKYIDFSSGYAVTNAGWQRKEVIDAVKKQLDILSYSTLAFPTQPNLELSELLLSLVPNNLKKCARAVGGADANEIIIKSSVALNGKKKVLSLDRSYHGGTKLTVSMSSQIFNLPKFPTMIEYTQIPAPYCFRCPLKKERRSCNIDCAYLIEDTIKREKEIGAFIVEPVIGSGGVIVPPNEYLKIAQKICAQYKVTFALDEVITGFGRLGEMTAMDAFNIQPDAVSFAKGMGGGIIPIGTAVLSKDLAESIDKYDDVAGTFAWTPLASVAAKTNIELIINEKLHIAAKEKGEYLKQQLQVIFEKHMPRHLGEIRGMGLLIGIELVKANSKDKDIDLMNKLSTSIIEGGLMVSRTWLSDVIVLMPPLNISYQDLDSGLNIIEKQVMSMK